MGRIKLKSFRKDMPFIRRPAWGSSNMKGITMRSHMTDHGFRNCNTYPIAAKELPHSMTAHKMAAIGVQDFSAVSGAMIVSAGGLLTLEVRMAYPF